MEIKNEMSLNIAEKNERTLKKSKNINYNKWKAKVNLKKK